MPRQARAAPGPHTESSTAKREMCSRVRAFADYPRRNTPTSRVTGELEEVCDLKEASENSLGGNAVSTKRKTHSAIAIASAGQKARLCMPS